uniref:MADF domain-containing protein n=1 Tax=Meloidogyne hapla TaxID=6305 RepID=A0A1I8BAJ6_MELHA
MNRSGVSLNSEQKMKLIEAIHERPQIWDSSYEGFRSNPTRQGAFNEVAELLSESGSEIFTRIQVQEEWGKLRYCFTRIVKKLYDEGYISPNGTILPLNQEHQLITWPYWQPMNFLLEGVALQLCSTRGSGGGSNYGGDDGFIVGDNNNLHNKGNTRQNSEEPDNYKIRRSRKSNRGGLTTSSSNKQNKGNTNYLAIEEDLSKNQSTNDLLMSNLLNSFAPQDLLLSNLNALNEQFQPQQNEEEIEIINSDLKKEEENEKDFKEIEQKNNKQQNDINKNDFVNENLKGKRKRKKDDIYADSLSGLDLLLRQRIEASGQQINGHNNQKQRSYSPAPLEPSNTTKIINNKLNCTNSLNGSEGGGSIGNNSFLNGCGGGGGTIDDVNESFGRCIVHQLQMVAKKDTLLCVQMRKKLLEVCFEYEMQACKISKNDD